jgi:hypothetical protein
MLISMSTRKDKKAIGGCFLSVVWIPQVPGVEHSIDFQSEGYGRLVFMFRQLIESLPALYTSLGRLPQHLATQGWTLPASSARR